MIDNISRATRLGCTWQAEGIFVEIGTDENATRVDRLYSELLDAVQAGNALSAQADLVYQIEMLSQEVNSGASFEQYFRWVRVTRDVKILQYLGDLGLPEVRGIVERAVDTAFPDGIPEDDAEYDLCTEWSQDQEEQLATLVGEFESYNGVIMNKLGQYIKENNLTAFESDEQESSEHDSSQKAADPWSTLARLIQRASFDDLPEIQRNACFVMWYDAGVRNGGHWRYFSDSANFNQSQVIGALRQLGAEEQAGILGQALARIPKELSLSEADDQFMDGVDISDLYDLDAAFAECSTKLEECLKLYLAQHLDEFTD